MSVWKPSTVVPFKTVSLLYEVDKNHRKANLLIEDEFGIDTDGLFVCPNGRRSGSQSIPGMGG
ncbi:MAG: hypothetical protein V3S41_07455, partial [Spirochaetia bacterium]